ncbi:MAG: hypothetical protein Tsb002_23620 [Wenzhouxiangellaceae bacterium]
MNKEISKTDDNPNKTIGTPSNTARNKTLDNPSPVPNQKTEKKWSDTKTWIMGMVASIIVGVISWAALETITLFNNDEPQLIKPVSPPDGTTFSHFPRTLNLEWQALTDASRYIVEVEAQDLDKWFPQPTESRLVSVTTSQSLEFIGAQPGRWKVTAIDDQEKIIGESPWWHFEFTN